MPSEAASGRIDGMETSKIDAALFAHYAGTHPDRWRQLVGREVEHVDERWGEGSVEDVRWGSLSEHVSPYLQIRVRYANHGLTAYRASSFHTHHRVVTVSIDLEHLLGRCYGDDMDEATRDALLERHDRALREAEDRRRLERADELRRRVTSRNTTQPPA
jgi:hypothetical protein